MTVSVTMIATRMGEDGDYWESGTSHDATDGFARYLVQGVEGVQAPTACVATTVNPSSWCFLGPNGSTSTVCC